MHVRKQHVGLSMETLVPRTLCCIWPATERPRHRNCCRVQIGRGLHWDRAAGGKPTAIMLFHRKNGTGKMRWAAEGTFGFAMLWSGGSQRLSLQAVLQPGPVHAPALAV